MRLVPCPCDIRQKRLGVVVFFLNFDWMKSIVCEGDECRKNESCYQRVGQVSFFLNTHCFKLAGARKGGGGGGG